MNSDKTILHLCADVGSDSLPYKEAGYNVILVGSKIGVENYHPPDNVYGIIANPPCTHFSIARTCAKTPRDLEEGMRLVKECLRVIWECQYNTKRVKINQSKNSPLKFWVIENPATGMLKWFLGNPTYQYSPHEFGSNFTKRTALWGRFNLPHKPFWVNQLKSKSSVSDKMGGVTARSMCYPAFAKAFFYVNQ